MAEPEAPFPPTPKTPDTPPDAAGPDDRGEELFVLSSAQHRLWFLDQLRPGGAEYNIPAAFRARGDLRPDVLAAALGDVVERHEILRTTFTSVADRPVQEIHPVMEVPVRRVDLAGLSGLGGERRIGTALAVARALVDLPFDLGRGPLLRVTIVRCAPDDHLVVVVMHHIVSDGWSVRVLIRELAALYRDRVEGGEGALPELPIQYVDYAYWQREWLAGDEAAAQLAFWRDRLEGAPARIELPADRRADGRGRRGRKPGRREVLRLDGEAVASLDRWSRARGVTPFVTLLSAFSSLLARYTGQDDLVLGTPVANRTRPEVRDLLGFLVNTLALRLRVDEGASFEAHASRVADGVLDAFAHQELPFETVVEHLAPEREGDRQPLFRVMFVVEEPPGEVELPGLTLSPVDVHATTAKFDLTLYLRRTPDGLTAVAEHDAELFHASTVRRLLGHLDRWLAALAADPERPLGALPLLAPAERSQLLLEWNERHPIAGAGAEVLERSVEALFRERAARRPDRVALTWSGPGGGEGHLSYHALARRAAGLGAELRRRGVGTDEAVGLMVDRGPELIVSLLAILEAGGAYVPLDPALPAERLRFMAEDAGLRRVLVSGDLTGTAALPEDVERIEVPPGGALPGSDREPAPPERAPSPGGDRLAYVAYTSGSTGRPKGVAVPHRAVVRLVRPPGGPGFVDLSDRSGEPRFLQLAPVSFDASTLEVWGPLANGGRLALMPPRVPSLDELGDEIVRRRISVLWLTAGLFHQMVEARPDALRGVGQVLAGGDTLSPPHVAALLAAMPPGSRLVNGYGPTENTTFTCCAVMRPADAPGEGEPVAIGRPVAGTSVHLLDAAFRPVPLGAVGELFTGGDGLARGYRGRPALTAERFLPDPFSGVPGGRLYRTGDLARHLPDGRIDFLGRADDQVKIRGFRVELGEVAAALAEHPGVAEAVAVVRPGPSGEKRLLAYVVGSGAGAPDPGDLKEHLRSLLPAHMVPAVVVPLDELPLTPQGKVDRRALPVPERPAGAAGAGERAEPAPPRTPVEELVVDAFRDVLGAEAVGVDDDFFELGGHSLLATRLVSRLRRLLRADVPLGALFEHPSPAGLAAEIEALRAAGTREDAPPPLRAGAAADDGLGPRRAPLSFAQQRLWFVERFAPGRPTYNVSVALRLTGPLDAAALEGAVGDLVARHAALRTTFESGEDGVPVQVVHPSSPDGDFRLVRHDAAGGSGDPDARAEELAAEEAGRPFDLEAGPLLRGALVRLGDERHLFLLTVHHIAADGWSMGILTRDLSAFYAARLAGPTGIGAPALPPLPIDGADFARWQRGWLAGPVLERELDHWRRVLDPLPAPLDLPADRPRPPVRSERGAVRRAALPAALRAGVEALARRSGGTLFMTLLAAFAALLARYTGRGDLAVGSPIANRTREETEGLVGFFVNTLVLRLDLSGDPGFAELVDRVRGVTLDAFAHQDAPFERLVEATIRDRDPSRPPLVQVVFALQDALRQAPRLSGVETELLPSPVRSAKFDLSLFAGSAVDGTGSGGLRLTAEYATELFDATRIDRLLGHLEVLLVGAVADPAAPLSALPLLAPAERHQLRVEWSDTAFPAPPPVPARIAAQVAARPDAVALVEGASADGADGRAGLEGHWSYEALDRRARALAARLRRLPADLPPDAPVAVSAGRGAAQVAAQLGAFHAGRPYLPVDPTYPEERIEYIARDGGAAVVLADEPSAALLEGLAGDLTVWPVEEATTPSTPAEEPAGGAPESDTDALAYVIYTSGSTGKPKGIGVPHRGLANLVGWHLAAYGTGPGSRVSQVASLGFDAAVWEVWPALAAGATLYQVEEAVRSEPPALAAWLAERGLTESFLPTPLAEEVLALPWPADAALGVLLTGGDRLRRRGGERPFALVNHYGPTEGSVVATRGRVAAEGAALPTLGRPVGGVGAWIVDGALRPAPLGVPGELVIAGRSLARGYLGRPGRTAESFVPDPLATDPGGRLYKTGDLARHRADGRIEFLGRIDRQVKVRGFRIELGEIEAVLAGRPEVREAVCRAVGSGGDGAGTRLIAYAVVDRPADAELEGRLLEELAAELPRYMVPSALVLLPELPRTAHGKVDEEALDRLSRLERSRTGAAADTAGRVVPRTPAEERVAAVFGEVLELDSVPLEEDFFSLGGHSLLAAQAVSRLRDRGYDTGVRTLFEHPTAASLAAALERDRLSSPGSADGLDIPIVRRPPEAERVLSYGQARLWFLQRLEPGTSAYNIPAVLGLSGRCDLPALAAAVAGVVARHDVLRTVIEARGEGPRPWVLPPAGSPLRLVDLSGLPAGARRRALDEGVAWAGAAPFDLATGPVLRVALWRLDPETHALGLTVHHAASDGWSMGILVREIAALYEAARSAPGARATADALPELPVSYSDFAAWQRERVEGGDLDGQIEYWRRTLEGAPEALDLPTDRPRAKLRTSRGGQVTRRLDPAAADELAALARRAGATDFMVLLSVLGLLLGRVGGSDDVLVGTPVAGRSRPEVEPLVGCFLNTLALRLRAPVESEATFLDLLDATREVALGAFAHQDLPFERVLDAVRPGRNLARTPLFQVVLNMLNLPEHDLAVEGLRFDLPPTPPVQSKFDFTLYARRPAGSSGSRGLELHLVYDRALFDPARAEAIADQVEGLLRQAAAEPDTPVERLSLVTERARKVLPDPEAPLQATWEGSVVDRFLAAVRAGGDRTAVTDREGDVGASWSYAEVERRTRVVAEALAETGVEPGDAVVVHAGRSASFVWSLLGVLRLGALFAVVDGAQPPAYKARLLERLGPRAWLDTDGAEGGGDLDLLAGLPRLDAGARSSLFGRRTRLSPEVGAGIAGPDTPAYVGFTSGSTGEPKGVVGRHGSLAHSLTWTRRAFGLSPDDRCGMLASLAHDQLHRDVFVPLQLGATCHVPEAGGFGRPGRIARWLAEERIGVINITPAIVRLLCERPARPEGDEPAELPALRLALVAGEVFTPELVLALRALAPRVACIDVYGTTEAQQAVGFHPVTEEELTDRALRHRSFPIGRGASEVQLLVRGRGDRPAGIGELGEIAIRSPHLADTVYRTGDLGRYRPDGEVDFAGRRDLQVKIRDFRIELAEVEAALEALPGVLRAAATVHRPHTADAYLAGYLVPAPSGGGEIDRQALRRQLRERLPDFMVPRTLTLMEELPRTASGKLARRLLPEPSADDRAAGAGEHEPPETPDEELIAAVWGEVLELPRVGRTDSFFDLGGDSLSATRVVARIRDAGGVELPLRALFEEASVADLARRLDRVRREGSGTAPPPLEPAPRDGALPLSYSQERLWFLDQLDPGNPTLNLPSLFRLRGRLDVPALLRGLEEIGRRHEVLRTSYVSRHGRPVQRIHPRLDLEVARVDLSALPAEERDGALGEHAARAAARPFDLEAGGPLRATLYRLAPDEHALLLVTHHVAADAWSLGVFFRELSQLYGAFEAGAEGAFETSAERSPLPALPIQYADFARWQRAWLRGETLERWMSYWRRQLGDDPPPLELPTDRPRQSRRATGSRHGFLLPRETVERVEAYGARRGATLFMTLLTAFEVVLHRYSGQDDVILGTPIANRGDSRLESMIGLFFNLLALRVRFDGDPSFDALLERVREVTFDAYAHQDLPFEKVLEELRPERQLSFQPFFNVSFVVQNVPLDRVRLTGLELETLPVEKGTAYFDLTLFVDRAESGYRVTLEYRDDLFDATTIRRMGHHYVRALEGGIAEPDRPVAELPLLAPSERFQILRAWNDTEGGRDERLLGDLFTEAAAARPDAVAVEAADGTLSYGELAARVERLAGRLRALGAGPGAMIAICSERTSHLVEALLAVVETGAAYVPLEPSYPAERVRWIVSTLGVRTVLTVASLADRIEGYGLPGIDHLLRLDRPHDGPGLPGTATDAAPLSPLAGRRAAPDELAYVIFTSGSTGRPKGVMLRHRPVVNLIHWVNRTFGVGPGDRLLFVTSPCFDLSVYDVFGALGAGATVRVASGDELGDPDGLAELLDREAITFWDSAPAALQQISPFLPRPRPGEPPRPLRLVFLSGDWIPLALPDRVREAFTGARVVSLGGATEAAIWSNWFPVREIDPSWVSVPYGVPITNAEYHVLDRRLAPVPVGVEADLYIGGECLSDGYAADPAQSAEKYLPDPYSRRPGGRLYATGDRARYRPDGNLEFLGRRDQQVKIRGYRIELGEIEGVLAEHPRVREAVVLAVGEPLGDRRLVAFTVLARDAGADARTADAEPDGAGALQVDRWQQIYDETYRDDSAIVDPTLNLAGWRSSYDGSPLPEEAMREWIEGTVERLLALGPRRVLEIGCGTGMILFRVAPEVERYRATDLSAQSIEYVRRHLPAAGVDPERVELEQREADDWRGIDAGSFDLVVINSVTQHFPDAAYLRRVLAGAVAAVAPGGALFVGDVRSLTHLEAFHASIQLERAEGGLDAEAFRRRVRSRVEREEDLVIDPRFFARLAGELPAVTGLRIELRRGSHHDELTRFRYDAVLEVGGEPSGPPPEADWRAWAADGDPGGAAAIARRLDEEAPEVLALAAVPNARLRGERAVLAWMAGAEAAHGVPTLAALRERLDEIDSTSGEVDPEELWRLAAERSYRAEIAPSPGEPGAFDVLLSRVAAAARPGGGASAGEAAGEGAGRALHAFRGPAPADPAEELTNDPLRSMDESLVLEDLRRHAASRLPEYMVPSSLRALDALPVTANGKLDRKALLAMAESASTERTVEHAAPESVTEKLVAGIWSNVLGLESVGVHDDFFEIGGHSLLATQAVARLRETFGVELSLRTLFEVSTVGALAAHLDELRGGGARADAAPLVPVPRDGAPPASFSQQRLWFLDLLVPGSPLYNVPVALRLDGRLDLAALQGALDALVARHESLRTTLAETAAGEAVQRIAPPEGPAARRVARMARVDLTGLPPERREEEAARALRAEGRRPFDLRRGPLFRAALVALDDDAWNLALVVHHAVTDGWSVGVMVRELGELYRARSEGRTARLAELPVQYADFADWQRRELSGERLERLLGFWRGHLEGAPGLLRLPTDRPRPAFQRFRGARLGFAVPRRTADGLAALARAEDATPFMALLSVLQVLLARYSGQDDFVLGTPVANRQRPELEPLIGFFVNTLALRSDLRAPAVTADPDEREDGRPAGFRDLLRRVRDTTLAAYEHQDLPFEKLVQELGLDRDPSHTPLFQVMLVLQNAPLPEVELPGLRLTAEPVDARPASFDLSFFLVEDERGIGGRVLYNTDLFDRATIARWTGHLERLVAEVAAAPDRPLPVHGFLAPAERQALLVEWNDPRVGYRVERPLHASIAERSEREPDAVAVLDGGAALSFGELRRRVLWLARRLRAAGAARGERVGVCLEPSFRTVVALLAVHEAGAAFVPLDPASPPERVRRIVSDAGCRAVLTEEGVLERLPEGPEYLVLGDLDRAPDAPAPGTGADPEPLPAPPASLDHLAYVMYTSGSTGEPKGVMVTQRGLAHRIRFARAAGHLFPGDRFLQRAALGFDVSLLEIFQPLLAGGAVVVADAASRRDPRELVRILARDRVSQIIVPPSLLQFLVEEDLGGCQALHTVTSSAEALSVELRERVLATLGARLYNRYGPTETSIAVTSWLCEPGDPGRAVPIGRPIAGARLHVLDRDGATVPVGVPGELHVAGTCLARGYAGRPAITASAFIPDTFGEEPGARLYRTGDLVRYRPDGALEFLARIDHQVKVRGIRVEPGEVEGVLEGHPAVGDAVVVAREGAGGPRLVAYAVPRAGAEAPPEELRAYLAERLPAILVPSAVVALDALPLNASGKVDLAALPDPPAAVPVAAGVARSAAPAAPARPAHPVDPGGTRLLDGALQRKIAAVWAEVLEVGAVGPDDNFFDVGGHSLLAVRVRNRLRELLDREIPLVDLFRHPTVASLAAHLRESGAVAEGAPLALEDDPVARVRARLEARTAALPAVGRTEIAIVGMAGRFPGAPDLDAFWRNLAAGVESISTFGSDDLAAAGVPSRLIDHPRYVPAAGVLDDVESFDAGFFDMPPAEAALVDPQQRIFLECAWEALESAGHDPARFGGRVGVFGGTGMNTYLRNLYGRPEVVEAAGGYQLLISSDKDFLATRVSYKLGLKGPGVTVQTACSTSLVAIHLACRSLLEDECDMALAGGVSVTVPQTAGYLYQPGMILSPDGHCRAFDAEAGGTVRGSGSGVVVLRRLADALADGDPVLAVVKGSAINNDGAEKVGYTAPGAEGQAEVLAEAYARAGVDPGTVGYVEAHGTGTRLGDPIEISALTRVFGDALEARGRRVALGSLKTNVGHLNTAAGVAGVIKTVLSLGHRSLPPSLHFRTPNPEAGLDESPFYVNDRLAEWPEEGGPRRAGVSSFGIGGTNAHVVLEEAPEPEPSPLPARPEQVLVVSGRSEAALSAAKERLARRLEVDPPDGPAFADAAYTLQAGRRRFEHRWFALAKDAGEAAAKLRGAGGEAATAEAGRIGARPTGGGVVYLLPGQGAQRPGMGRELYRTEPLYREVLDRAVAAFRPHLTGGDLLEVIHEEDGDDARLRETAWTQPALFAVEHALATLWTSWGVPPAALAGHSLGEYTAACLARVLDLDDAAAVVAARGRLLQARPPGSMLAVELPEEEVTGLLDEAEGILALAAVNAPAQCVVSGEDGAIEALARRLAADGVRHRRLETSHAFHSPLMAGAEAPLLEVLRGVRLAPPRVPFVSNVTGTWITDEQATDPAYWARHLLSPVRFGDGLAAVLDAAPAALLEVGPGRTLGRLARMRPAPAGGSRPATVASLPDVDAAGGGETGETGAQAVLGRLWLAGADVDWTAVHGGVRRRRVALPTYPFQRERHWIDPAEPAGGRAERTPRALKRLAETASPVAPYESTELTDRIAALWSSLLGRPDVGPDDDFFDLGGSSLLAVQAASHLSEALGIEVPPQLPLEAPTPAEQARRLRTRLESVETAAEPLPECLVELQAGDGPDPLFLVHPAGGHVFFYRRLARLLDPGRPVWGLQSEGLPDTADHRKVEALAEHYLAAIRLVRPDGPYLLGGSSMGGTVAFEMARRLREDGAEVPLLTLIDTPGPRQMPRRIRDDAGLLESMAGDRIPVAADELRGLDPDDQLRLVFDRARDTGLLPAEVDVAMARRLLERLKAHMRAMRAYRPAPYDGPILYLRASERRDGDPKHPERPWIDVAHGGIEIEPVPGNHVTLHGEPNLEVVARAIRRRLERVGEP